MSEGARYINGLHLCDFILMEGVKIWAHIEGRGLFFYGWDWMDAPYREDDSDDTKS